MTLVSCTITTGVGSCGGGSFSGQTFNGGLDLNNAAAARYVFTGVLAALPAAGVITNTAGIQRTVDVTDPDATNPDPAPPASSLAGIQAECAAAGAAGTCNNIKTDMATVIETADLSIAKTGPATVIPGQTVTYTLIVTNNGPSAASGVQVNDPTPTGLTVVSNAGACTTAFPCALGSLGVGATQTITTTFQVPAD